MTVIGAMLLKADIAALVLCAATGIIVTLIIMSGRVLSRYNHSPGLIMMEGCPSLKHLLLPSSAPAKTSGLVELRLAPHSTREVC